MSFPVVPAVIVALIAAAAAGSSSRRRRRGGSTEIVFDEGDTITGSGGGAGGGGYTPGTGQGSGAIGSYAQMPAPVDERQALMREMFEALGFDPMWSMFFEATAKNESGFNELAGLGKPELFPPWSEPNTRASVSVQNNEADAATRAYERNKEHLSGCGWPKSRYTFGSGGWFAMLPANAVMQAPRGNPMRCIDPWEIFDPAVSVVFALGMARGLTNWRNFKTEPTFGNLRVGWGNPSSMGKQDRLQGARTSSRGFASRLAELGFDPDLFDHPVVPMPPYEPEAMLARLRSLF